MVNIVFQLKNPENKNYLRSMLYRNFLLAYEKAIGGRKIASGGQLMRTRGAGRILDGPWMMQRNGGQRKGIVNNDVME